MSTTRRSFEIHAATLALALAGAFALTAHAAPGGPGGYGGGPGACGAMMGGGYGPGPMMGGYGPGGRGGHGPMMGGPGGRVGMGMGLSEQMLDRVNATPEQRTQLRKIAQDAATEMQAQHEAGRALRDQMTQLFSQPTIDANAVETMRQQMQAQRDQASKRRMQAMIDASRVLTAEQRKLIADTAKQRGEMFERHRRERQTLEAPKS